MSKLSLAQTPQEQIAEICLLNKGDPIISIGVMNMVFKIPDVVDTSADYAKRIGEFMDIFHEEFEEGFAIHSALLHDATCETTKVDMADWLGDMIIYCVSEMFRWDIPVHPILSIIMASNFSKLDDEGKAIFDSRMKLLKSSNYWKPEPYIKDFLAARPKNSGSQKGE
jgi:predicted HAD superfamily Cof-like phosphohydrolase